MSLEHLSAAVNAKVNDDARKQGTMTLGGLRTALALLPPETPVRFDHGGSPGDLDSYRGYYERLAFDSSTEPTTAQALIGKLNDADGKSFEGYKGGTYYMDSGTFIHSAEYGCCGPFIASVRLEGDTAILETAEEEW